MAIHDEPSRSGGSAEEREQQPPPRSLRGAGERCEGAGDEARLRFAVAPPSRVHKQPRPLLGDRLVKEAVDRPVGDLRRERRLLLDAARNDQHHVRELRLELPGHLSRGRGERGGIEHHDPGVQRHERGGEIGFGADRAQLVRRIRHSLERGEESGVVGQHEQRLPGKRQLRCNVAGRSRCTLRFGVRGAGCHNLKPARRAQSPAAGYHDVISLACR